MDKGLTMKQKIPDFILSLKRNVKRSYVGWLLALPAVLVLFISIWRPQFFGIVWSFCKMSGYEAVAFCGLDNYIAVIKDARFLKYLWNTIQYVLWSLLIGYPLPFILAVMLNEVMHLKKGLKTIIYYPAIMPGIVSLLLWKLMYSPDSSGLLNMMLNHMGMDNYTWLNDSNMVIFWITVMDTWKGMGGTMLLYYCALQGLNTDIYEAALIDGAGVWKKFIHVTIPQMAGTLLLCAIRQIIGIFQILNEPLVMTGGGPDNASASLGFMVYRWGFEELKIGKSLATGGLMFILLIGITIVYFKLEKKNQENI